MLKKLLLAFLFVVGAASAQIFPQAASSIRAGASLPAVCRDSQVFFVNNTGMYQCVAGVWTAVPTAASGGTVTVVAAGSLTSTALVTGGGSQTIQTPSATTTLDSSGNISTPGSISTGVGGSAAGFWQCTQGTAHTVSANSSGFQCPTSVTSGFMFTLPGAPAAGLLHATNATPSVLSVSAVSLTADVSGVLPTANIAVALANQTSIHGITAGTAAGNATLGQVIASGNKALDFASTATGACATVITDTATGTLTTDRIIFNANASIKAVTGYVPASTGGFSIAAYPTSDTVNFEACNWTAGTVDPGSITVNWIVIR